MKETIYILIGVTLIVAFPIVLYFGLQGSMMCLVLSSVIVSCQVLLRQDMVFDELKEIRKSKDNEVIKWKDNAIHWQNNHRREHEAYLSLLDENDRLKEEKKTLHDAQLAFYERIGKDNMCLECEKKDTKCSGK